MTKYTEKELAELLNISRQYLSEKRNGRQFKRTLKKGNVESYNYPPILIEREDYIWERGRLYYFESAINKITKKSPLN